MKSVSQTGVSTAVGRKKSVRLPPETLPALQAAVEPAWWRGVDEEPHALYASGYRALLEVDGIEVDALGGMALRVEGRVCPLPFAQEGSAALGGVEIPLAPLAQWWLVYRPYKPERAALVEPLLTAAQRAAALRLLGDPA